MNKAFKKLSVDQLFWEQVALTFIVVAVMIACGALLTFKVTGEEYSQWTVVGFFATVFFAFIVFLPAGTLFAARAEFAKEKVRGSRRREDRRGRADRQSPARDRAFGRGVRRSRHGHRLWARLRHGMDALAARHDARFAPLRRPLCDHRETEHLPRYRRIGGAGRIPGEGGDVEDAPYLVDLRHPKRGL